MEKKEARRLIAKNIAALTAEDRAEKSARILERLLHLPEFRASRNCMLFVSMSDELDTKPVIEAALREGRRVFLPKVYLEEKSMRIYRLRTLGELREGSYGIEEPDETEEAVPEEIDFVLVPARAFDERGDRLGRGAGYYDKFLAADRVWAPRCGAAYECQLLESVPVTDSDLPVDVVVTEERTLRCHAWERRLIAPSSGE